MALDSFYSTSLCRHIIFLIINTVKFVLFVITNKLDFDSIYLDFAKAFDKVDHEILIKNYSYMEFTQKLSIGSAPFLLIECRVYLAMAKYPFWP